MTAKIKKLHSKNEMQLFWWERMDSNHRSEDATDLQSAPIGHSGTLPYSINGAGGRIRTPDLLITNQLLYQLSYASTQVMVFIIHILLTFVKDFFRSLGGSSSSQLQIIA